ncbi:RNA pseudouridine synthase [Opitutus sp. ER46]|nr:RNA pseudouridine synthase [Opitutus sp. ER46]
MEEPGVHVCRVETSETAGGAPRGDGPRPLPAGSGGLVSDVPTTGPVGEPDDVFSRRACAWPRRPRTTGPVRMIDPSEVPGWVVYEDERLLVVNKPGDVVCHPSKAGPWSSLVGALREYSGLPTVHLVFRLDRETSGIVVLTKDAAMASRLQVAMQKRTVGKAYVAILRGRLTAPVTVDQPLGDDVHSMVFLKSAVTTDGQKAVSHFTPLSVSPAEAAEPFSLVRVVTETGRKHQIRAHAEWLGHPMVGDKIYGGDATCYLEFIDHGWTPRLAAQLLLSRQALHCAEIDLRGAGLDHVFTAPLAADMQTFCAERGLALPA